MTDIQRQRVVWTGFPGSPGLSTFYFADAAAAQTDLRALLAAIATHIPPDVTMTIEPGGDVISDSNGVLTAVWAGTAQTPQQGTNGETQYAAPVGVLFRWETLTIAAGSRLRGRTYIVPTSRGVFDAQGNVNTADLASFATAASNFVGSVTPNLLVWQRPRTARAAYTDGFGKAHRALAGRPGSSAVVVSSSVPDLAAVLRSRRD